MRCSVRRRLCRLTFVMACVLPTLVVGGTALVVNTPAYRSWQAAAWRARWAVQLGLEIELAGCERTLAHRWILRELELRDPATHEWLARVRAAQLDRTPQGYVVRLGQPQIHAGRVHRLAALLHEHLLLRGAALPGPVHLASSSVEWVGDQSSESVLDVRCTVEAAASGTEVFVEFRPATADQPIRARIVHNRQLDPPGTGWELHTGATAFPCSLVRGWLPALSHLGDECLFEGSVWCEQQLSGWEADVRGRFSHVDLDQLVTRQFPHKLSGMAELTFERCHLASGRIANVVGHLQSAGGVVSQSLLDAAERSLGLHQQPRDGEAILLRYAQLSLEFRLSTTGLVIAAPATAETTLMSDSHGPLLVQQAPSQRSPLDLVHLLVPQADVQVPATRETAAVISILPLPELATRPATASRTSYAPLHLHLR